MTTMHSILMAICFTGTALADLTPDEGSPVVDINKEIVAKKIDLKGWKAKGAELKKLKIGMTRENIYKLLGKPDPYPEDHKDVCQYSPTPFHGGENGPDWSLLIYFKDDKITGFRFRKSVYGPPPG